VARVIDRARRARVVKGKAAVASMAIVLVGAAMCGPAVLLAGAGNSGALAALGAQGGDCSGVALVAATTSGPSVDGPALTGLAPAGTAVLAEQWRNAAAIVAQGRTDGVSVHGLIVGLMTARQESSLVNVGHGDTAGPDSIGLFQQRDPWGPRAVRMDPAGTAHLFYTGGVSPGTPGLLDIPGWQAMDLSAAAQAVQRSAFPDAYARWQPLATQMLAHLDGGPLPDTAGACWGATGVSDGTCPPPSAGSAYPNGRLPVSALCPLVTADGHMLRTDAAHAFDAMSTAYRARFGEPICVTDSYRDYDTQVRLYAEKPNLAAVPGTSNHGWGTATDLCGGVQNFGTITRAWMTDNAGRYGWVSPPWAQPSGSRPEPWHWEYAAGATA
jgi:hypothetical protein